MLAHIQSIQIPKVFGNYQGRSKMSARTKQLFTCQNGHTFEATLAQMRGSVKCPMCLSSMRQKKELMFEGRVYDGVRELSFSTGVPHDYIKIWMRNGLSAEQAIHQFYSKRKDKREAKSWKDWEDLKNREKKIKELKWDTNTNSLSEFVQKVTKTQSELNWRDDEVKILTEKATEGVIIDSIALQLKKSPEEIIRKMHELGVFDKHAQAHPVYLQNLADAVAGKTTKLDANLSVTDPNIVARIVYGDETKTVEFKQTYSKCLKSGKSKASYVIHSVLKTVAAFANTGGGQLFIGVQDNPRAITGLELDDYKNDRDEYTKNIISRIKEYLGTMATSLVNIEIIDIEEKEICLINVTASSEPVFCTHNEYDKNHQKYDRNPEYMYVRMSGETHKLKPSEMISYCNRYFGNRI